MKNFKYYKPFAIVAMASGLTLLSGCGSTQNEDTEVQDSQIENTEDLQDIEMYNCRHLIVDLGEDILIRECDGYNITANIRYGLYNYDIKDASSGEVLLDGLTNEYNQYIPKNHEEMIKLEEEMIEEGKVKLYTLK